MTKQSITPELLEALIWIKAEFDRTGIGDGADHENSERHYLTITRTVKKSLEL